VPEGSEKRLERRVVGAAEEALADHGFVSPIDVLCRLGWLHRSNVERCRRGRPARLEDVVFIEPAKIASAIRLLQTWAIELAVSASVRHGDTCYDELLMSGVDRQTARAHVRDDVASLLDAWRTPPPGSASVHTSGATG
jgi:hypothetical protein